VKDLADLFGLAQVGNGIGDGVVVLELEQWRELAVAALALEAIPFQAEGPATSE
jgi:hypothetical protein